MTQNRLVPHTEVDQIYDTYLELLLCGKRKQCLDIVNDLVQRNAPLKSIYLGLFERSMYQVGELWETNQVSVAVEHIATAITENALNLIYPIIFSAEHCGRKAIISCIANEYHQIGGKMVADIFELHGWDGYFLGANSPVKDMLRLIEEKQPDLVCLSLTLFANFPELIRHITTLRGIYPYLPILVGGQAFRWGGGRRLEALQQVHLVNSLDELEAIINGFPGSMT